MDSNECDHVFVQTGKQHKKEVMRGYYEFWDSYFCQRCLKHRYVLVRTEGDYTTKLHDGSKRVDELEIR